MTVRSICPHLFALGLVGVLACDGAGTSGESGAADSTAAPANTEAARDEAPPQKKPEAPAVNTDVPEAAADANITMDSTTVNDFEMKKVSCKTSAGLLGSTAILGVLAQGKPTFEGCAKTKQEVRVHFVFSSEGTKDVRVAGASSDDVAGCVADVVQKSSFPNDGTCVVSFAVGA